MTFDRPECFGTSDSFTWERGLNQKCKKCKVEKRCHDEAQSRTDAVNLYFLGLNIENAVSAWECALDSYVMQGEQISIQTLEEILATRKDVTNEKNIP